MLKSFQNGVGHGDIELLQTGIRKRKALDQIQAPAVRPEHQTIGCSGIATMGYSVKFYKTLVNSEGHSFTLVQREIPVLSAGSAGEALDFAVKRFEELEGVASWRLRADTVEIEPRREYQLAKATGQLDRSVPSQVHAAPVTKARGRIKVR